MRYQIVDLVNRSLNASAVAFGAVKTWTESDLWPLRDTPVGRLQSGLLETTVRLLRHYPKRGWNFPDVVVGRRRHPVQEAVALEKPFCKLMRFARTGLPARAPRVLFVAALSGHHATLSRETFAAFLPDHEVFVTDWTDARMVPLAEGRFGFEEYIEYVVEFLEHLGPGTHVVALCQAGVPALAATAVLAAADSPCRPRSLAFMASPMDIRVNPNLLSHIAGLVNSRLVSTFAIYRVPNRYPGRGRLVYPGWLQLGGFMTLSLRSHLESHVEFLRAVYRGDYAAADKFRDFYDEYFSVLDCTAEFYLETLENVFIDQTLPKGLLKFRGQTVDCGAIVDVPLFALEGAKDNMVAPGQCRAALDFCPNLPDELKEYRLQEGVGHYGIFSGSRFRAEIAPALKAFIRRHHRP